MLLVKIFAVTTQVIVAAVNLDDDPIFSRQEGIAVGAGGEEGDLRQALLKENLPGHSPLLYQFGRGGEDEIHEPVLHEEAVFDKGDQPEEAYEYITRPNTLFKGVVIDEGDGLDEARQYYTRPTTLLDEISETQPEFEHYTEPAYDTLNHKTRPDEKMDGMNATEQDPNHYSQPDYDTVRSPPPPIKNTESIFDEQNFDATEPGSEENTHPELNGHGAGNPVVWVTNPIFRTFPEFDRQFDGDGADRIIPRDRVISPFELPDVEELDEEEQHETEPHFAQEEEATREEPDDIAGQTYEIERTDEVFRVPMKTEYVDDSDHAQEKGPGNPGSFYVEDEDQATEQENDNTFYVTEQEDDNTFYVTEQEDDGTFYVTEPRDTTTTLGTKTPRTEEQESVGDVKRPAFRGSSGNPAS